VRVVFNEPVEQGSAESSSNYAIDGGVSVSAASLAADLKTVILTVSPLTSDVLNTLTVTGVCDRAADPNPIASGNQATFTWTSIRYTLYVTRSAAEDLYDNPVVNRLEVLGHVVTAIDASVSQTSDADGKDLVIISSLPSSKHVNSKFSAVETPMIFWEAALCDDIMLSDKETIPSSLETSIDIVNTNHALAQSAGLTLLGAVATRNSGGEMQFADTDNLAAGATVIARKTGSDLPALAVIDQGSSLSDGSTAPGMRLFLFYGDDGLNNATQSGLDIFDGAVSYALSGGAPPVTSRGTPHEWLDSHGLVGEGDDYEAADNADDDFDGMSNWEEYLCDTDPTNDASCLRIGNATSNSPFTLHFQSSSNRTYTMIGCTNLLADTWFNVPGAGPRPGAGGPDSMQDLTPPDSPTCIYSLKVSLPPST